MKISRLPLSLSTISIALCAQFAVANQDKSLESIVVIGKSSSVSSSNLAGSFDYMGREEISYQHIDDLKELFTKVPGVYLSRFNQGIVNTILSIRGFAGDGASPHAKLLIDGIPANMHAGYGELDQLFPIAIDHIEMFRATSDPRYGLFNIAGNYQVKSRSDSSADLELTLGSFNTREIQGYFGQEDDTLSHSYSLGYRKNEGYRDHTDITKKAISGRWDWQLNSDSTLGAIARYSRYEGSAPSYLSEQEARDNPTMSADYASQDGGVKENHHISLHYDTAINNQVDWAVKVYSQNFQRNRWVRFSAHSDIQNRFDDQDMLGAISTLTWQIDPNWALLWGVDLQNEEIIEQRFGTVGQTRERDDQVVKRNRQFSYDTKGSYLQLQHQPNDKLNWNVALRVDDLSGDYSEFAADGTRSDREMYDFDLVVQPKLNVIYALTDNTAVFFNTGRSFQHPTGKAAFTSGDINAREMTHNDGAEIGSQWSVDAVELRASYWVQKAKNEFVLIDGEQKNVGKTTRNGIDLAGNWQVSNAFTVWANYSYIDTEIVTPSDSANVTKGNQLRSIPDFTASLGASFDATEKLVLRVHLDAQGDYYVNEENAGKKYGDYTLLNASADYHLDWATIKLQLNNLTDEYYEYVYDFGGVDSNGVYQTDTVHSPGDGRNASLSLSMSF